MAKLSVMLLCCNRGLSAGAMTPRYLVDTLSAAGVTGLEPAPTWCEQEPALWSELRTIAEGRGMAWSCCDVMVNFIGDGTPAARLEALDRVEKGIEFCREIGCSLALLPGTKPCEGMSNAEGRRIYGERLAEAAEKAVGSGVGLMIEDFGVYPNFAASGTHCAEVLALAGDEIGMNFDNGNFLLGGELPSECYVMFRDRIRHVHIKDFRVRSPDGRSSLVSPRGVGYEGCLIGSGDAQVDGCLKLLKADGYEEWLSIEAGGFDNLDEAVYGAEFISRCWD